MPLSSPRVHPSRRWLLPAALAAVVLLLLLVSGPLAGAGGRRVIPAEGGTLVERGRSTVERVNPLLAVTPAEHDLAALVFAGLTRTGPAGEPVPDLAEEWAASPDGRVFVFRLRRDLSWHDGAPLTADDALFTIGLIQAGAAADPRLVEVWRLASLTKLDERTIQVTLPAPFAPLPAYATFGLLPVHLLRDLAPTVLGTAPFNRRPVGAGPFRLVDLTPERARLVRFDRYHLGAPYLDGVELRFDGAGENADAGVLEGSAGADGRVAYPLVAGQYAAVLLNNDSPLFAADTVRRALAAAVDRPALVRALLGGAGVATDVPFGPGSWAHDGLPPPRQDLETARALLAAAGWTAGTDGILRRGPRELRFTLLAVDEPAWLALAHALADAWGQIGVRVVVAPASEAVLRREFLDRRQYEAALVGWDPGPDPDPFSAWHSSLRGIPGANPANFADERSDQLLLEGRVNADLAARLDAYTQFQARFRELAPSIVLFSKVVRYAVRANVHLSLPSAVPDPSARFSDVRRWYTATRAGR